MTSTGDSSRIVVVRAAAELSERPLEGRGVASTAESPPPGMPSTSHMAAASRLAASDRSRECQLGVCAMDGRGPASRCVEVEDVSVAPDDRYARLLFWVSVSDSETGLYSEVSGESIEWSKSICDRRISLLSAGMKSAWITLGHN